MTSTDGQVPVLEARGLVKRYGQVTALDGTDFELRPGEILAVIGDNGAGKSTLIKALAGAIAPDEGEKLLEVEGTSKDSVLATALVPHQYPAGSGTETEFSIVRLGSTEKAKQVYSGMRPLTAQDVAEVIVWVATRPQHVNISQVLLNPTDQGSLTKVHRR